MGMGILRQRPSPTCSQLYAEPMRKFQLAAEGHGDRQPPEHLREPYQNNDGAAADLVCSLIRPAITRPNSL